MDTKALLQTIQTLAASDLDDGPIAAATERINQLADKSSDNDALEVGRAAVALVYSIRNRYAANNAALKLLADTHSAEVENLKRKHADNVNALQATRREELKRFAGVDATNERLRSLLIRRAHYESELAQLGAEVAKVL